jgi:type IV secretion system protein VirB8
MLKGSHKSLHEFDTSHAYRTAQYLLRYSVMVNVVLGLIFITLSGFLIYLFPLKTIEPVLVTVGDKSLKVVSIQTINPQLEGLTAYREALSRRFVLIKEAIDLQNDELRWNHLMRAYMMPKMSEEFIALMAEKNDSSPYKLAKEKQITRHIEILNSRPHPDSPTSIEVFWKAIDKDKKTGALLGQMTRRSIVQWTENVPDIPIEGQDLDSNPLGLRVTAYSDYPDS